MYNAFDQSKPIPRGANNLSEVFPGRPVTPATVMPIESH